MTPQLAPSAALERMPLLRPLALFEAFEEAELAAIAARFTERHYAKDEVVWRAGDVGDEFIVVVNGELAVWRANPAGDVIVAQVGPGECLGEIALLLNEPRSATVTCSRHADVLVLDRDAFADIVRSDTRALQYVSRLLSRRAARLLAGQTQLHDTTVVAVTAADNEPGAYIVAPAVCALLTRLTGRDSLLLRNSDDAPSIHELAQQPMTSLRTTSARRRHYHELSANWRGGGPRDLAPLIDRLSGVYRHVVVALPPGIVGREAAETGDFLIPIAAGEEDRHTSRHTRVLPVEGATLARRPINHAEPYVLPDDPSLARLALDAQLDRIVDDPHRPLARVLGRLTRAVLGARVGLALGGGAAYGIAHVGVLASLEHAGIPVDLVAGTSMGSIVALGYASGLTPSKMQTIAASIGNVRTTVSVLDPTVSGAGFLTGHRISAILSPLLPVERFEDLAVPCRVVATDIETGEQVTIGDGRLDDAFRASCSVPLIFTPARRDGRILVDGAIVDPVPTRTVRNMGADIVVAINVVPQLTKAVENSMTRAFHRLNRINPFALLTRTRDMPHLLDTFMNSVQALEYELGNYKAADADVLLNINLAGFSWVEFYRATEIIDETTKATERDVASVAKMYRGRVSGTHALQSSL